MTRNFLTIVLAISLMLFLVYDYVHFSGNSALLSSPNIRMYYQGDTNNKTNKNNNNNNNNNNSILNKEKTIKKKNDQTEDELRSIEFYKKNWRGDCPYPEYVDTKLEKETWFCRFLHHLQQVNMTEVPKKRLKEKCCRWWYPTPKKLYADVPPRKLIWKEPLKPDQNFKRPNCSFGQERKPWTACSKAHEELWRELDKLGAIYFPRSGSELGVIRGSSYISSDGDVDIFVDIPQEKLFKSLRNVLTPTPHIDGHLSKLNAEIHWSVPGCPEVHLVFNEWMVDEMTKAGKSRPTHETTCNCYMDSSRLTCHKDAENRMYAQYGPSWFVPLHAKYLDDAHLARGTSIDKKLRTLISKDGVIREDAIRKLDQNIKYTKIEMDMILAQLNVLYQYIIHGWMVGYQKLNIGN